MRRSQIVIGATIAGTAGVLAFHPHASTVPRGTTATSSAATRSTTTSGHAAGSSGTSSRRTSGKSSGALRTTTGTAIPTQYGDVQVRVTVKNGKIASIEGLQLTGNDPRSAEISSSAEPTLKSEALTKQSAAIDVVSGATYTSAGYAQSLQSALDKLGFKAADGSRAALQVPS
ncbi:MAG: hypothetical protein QOK31_141 [Solirubrobacteraceae bacterium]|nr:hypothetical protein [Solirubrobacteraceae bacterium]